MIIFSNVKERNMSNLPLIIILDLDGTIIGNISPQIILHDILDELKDNGVKHSYKNRDFQNVLSNGLIRPYFTDFIKTLQKKIPHIEFFIYTASETKWGNYVIRQIENTINSKFNRPIFTRSDCIIDKDISKCLTKISPKIVKSLKKRYSQLSLKNIVEQIIVIDNNSVYKKQLDASKLLLCPTYDYIYLENIPQYILHNDYNEHYVSINTIFEKYFKYKVNNDYLEFQNEYFKYYISRYTIIKNINIGFLNDTFFRKLFKIMIYLFVEKRYLSFDEKVINYIKKQFEIK